MQKVIKNKSKNNQLVTIPIACIYLDSQGNIMKMFSKCVKNYLIAWYDGFRKSFILCHSRVGGRTQ
jgi:hypothetical protein